jgi:hypothetical protein
MSKSNRQPDQKECVAKDFESVLSGVQIFDTKVKAADSLMQ